MHHTKSVTTLILAAAATTAVGQTVHDVGVGPGITFSQPQLTIDVGDTVRWTWVSGFHSVESGVGGVHDGRFRSGDPTGVGGTVFQFTFDQSFIDANPTPDSVYPYYCVVHVGLGMTGAITVNPAGNVAGDADGDGDVDLDDFALFVSCEGGGESHSVSVGPGFTFSPADIVVAVGDTVRWTWAGGLHNVESGVGSVHDDNFRSGAPTSVDGTVFEMTFDRAFLDANPMVDDEYPYFCIIHEVLGMTGTVTVAGDPCGALDFDADGDVDFADFGVFQTVFAP